MVIPVSALPQTVAVPRSTTPAARTLDIPAPRPPSDRSARAEAGPGIRIPSPRVPSDVARAGQPVESGRHRAVVARLSRTDRALLIAGRAGSVTTLAALLVMSAAFAGVFDGSVPTGPAAQVATTTLR
ncbi:hypothetical protein EV383_5386 [Pseudonocardia sediminis]|uniref:Uncharacterized protein n=1 Tax=Pseudonocardia sediminis TaxID=1397368 RepID=A0A4Q7V4N8_PSEST|nr:hypothetical protein EV383_5386 [Pseudonocardia sediminis]